MGEVSDEKQTHPLLKEECEMNFILLQKKASELFHPLGSFLRVVTPTILSQRIHLDYARLDYARSLWTGSFHTRRS